MFNLISYVEKAAIIGCKFQKFIFQTNKKDAKH